MKIIYLLCFLFFSFGAFSKSKKIKSGYWHANFELNETTRLPVTFLFQKDASDWNVYVLNADEEIKLTDFKIVKDSVFIKFPAFDSEIHGRIEKKNLIKGYWHNYAKGKNYKIPFTSTNGCKSRFPKMDSKIDVYGKWEVTFNYDTQPEKAIGVFNPFKVYCTGNSDNLVKGTFLTETGDYRFLEGVVSSDSLLLSTFDGSHAFLFESKLANDTLWGNFYSGSHYKTNWYAVRNENFELTNPDSLTYMVNDDPIKFSLPDLNNETYNYPNDELAGKVTLIQITGTWCPNCLDENMYLVAQKAKYGDDLEIIAINFEMPSTTEEKIETVKQYKENLELDYTFLIGGKACKSCASDLFPMLNKIISFPTLIFIDKKGMVRRIHTGFNGPGTGMYYTNFVEETNKLIETMVSE